MQKCIEHEPGEDAGEERLVSRQGVHSGNEIVFGVGLLKKSTRACHQYLASQRLGFMHGQDKHLGVGQRLADLARGFESVQLRHAEVEYDHMRL